MNTQQNSNGRELGEIEIVRCLLVMPGGNATGESSMTKSQTPPVRQRTKGL